MKYLKLDDVPQFLEKLSARGEVFLPVEEDGVVNFRSEWEAQDPLSGVRQNNSVLSPKDLFFPQTEGVFRFSARDGELEITPALPEDRDLVLFGMRACDLRSLELLDRVFLEGEYEESTYAARREGAFILSWSCLEPESTCFCTAFQTDPGRPEGADVRLTDLGEGLAVEATSEAGEEFIADCGELLSDAEESLQDRTEVLQRRAAEKVELVPPVDGIEEPLAGMFESEIWDDVSFSCLGCGSCTYLCPTCHCYELESESLGQEGVRYKCWDSCMFSNYTRMAGGENPRPTKKERVRNRFLHKLQYFPERYDTYGCTGCGRCLKYCPVGMDITEFMARVKGVKIG